MPHWEILPFPQRPRHFEKLGTAHRVAMTSHQLGLGILDEALLSQLSPRLRQTTSDEKR